MILVCLTIRHRLTIVTVHFSSYPLQTGATLFTFLHSESPPNPSRSAIPPPLKPIWQYDKSEDPIFATPEGAWWQSADYLVTEDWERYEGWVGKERERWQVVGRLDGLGSIRRGGKWGFEVGWERKIGILGRGRSP